MITQSQRKLAIQAATRAGHVFRLKDWRYGYDKHRPGVLELAQTIENLIESYLRTGEPTESGRFVVEPDPISPEKLRVTLVLGSVER